MREIYALTGTSAAGKTTLWRSLQKHYPQYSYAAEAARLYYQENIVPKEQRSSYDNQRNIQLRSIEELKRAIDMEARIVITDSSLLSSIVYAKLGGNYETAERLLANIIGLLPLYTLFFLLNPHDIDYRLDPTDPVRKETEEQRLRVHELFCQELVRLNLPYVLLSGTVDERVATVSQRIEAR